jgi:hypothetical protein
MKRKFLVAATFVMLCLSGLLLGIGLGYADIPGLANKPAPSPSSEVPDFNRPGVVPLKVDPYSTACALQPAANPKPNQPRPPLPAGGFPLSRFRQGASNGASNGASRSGGPREVVRVADPTNFGDRFVRDVFGKPAILEPLIVLHETIFSLGSAINTFSNRHLRDADQISYHTLIGLDGTIVYLVPPDKRAFGASNSVFQGANGPESVKTNAKLQASVNNFSYHISLETPKDGQNNRPRHSGYSNAQYNSLAWLIAKTGVPTSRITTHKLVDRTGDRFDPRSFDGPRLLRLLESYSPSTEIAIRCIPPI